MFQSNNYSRDLLAITFAIALPTLVTAAYFLWLAGTSWVQVAYGVGKSVQFVFPVIFVWFFYRQKLSPLLVKHQAYVHASNVSNTEFPSSCCAGRFNLLVGLLFGIGVVTAMTLVYFFVLPTEITASLTSAVQEKVNNMGIDTLGKYLLLMAFYTVMHSFLEEYYWRWFVYDILRQQLTSWLAKLISSLGFMAHHVVLLATFFGWTSLYAWLFSVGVAIGGLFWCWQFDRPWGFRAAWFSHAIVDAGIFGLGIYILS